MTSVFRRRITYQIINTLNPYLKKEDRAIIYDSLPLSLKLSQPKHLPPQFEFSWKKIVKLKPELQDLVHPNTLTTYLKIRYYEFPIDGITDILTDSLTEEKLIFTVDQNQFSANVILNIIKNIENIPSWSCFFRNIPPENVIVEYSSPNVAKPFHFGHFRSTIVGNFVANICKYVGHKVTRLNYVGDWGLQYGILAVGFNKFGCEKELQKDPLNHLFEVYKQANEQNESNPSFNEEAKMYFKKMENGDADALALWQRLRDLSLKEMNATFIRSQGIASCNEDGSIEAIIAEENDKVEKAVLRKKDGTSLYLTRDLAAAIDRWKKYHFDSAFYVVDSTQRSHFQHLTHILKSMGYSWADEARERTLEGMRNSPNTKVTENLEQIAGVLGASSLIVNDFSMRRKRDYPFNWDKILNMKSNSGITLQYCHARLNNLKENCGIDLSMGCEFSYLSEPEALSLIHHLAKFEEAAYFAYTELEPCVLVHYLFSLSQEVGRALKALKVKGSHPCIAEARLLLFHSAHLVMRKGLQLLGVTPLDKM
ncbi:hypothetical protein CEXT_485221 [Caerostris extrusa]|uniref:Probable arginine--tRNA ligase, mitochondrial n=1 Tax=Caerostris extrusa TaxID=172846 RepID=A0AAV4Q337_CAEEX|nr:hypothetical protein CEXT_485221 [Caerostris extrusa]